MQLIVNGESREVPGVRSVAELVKAMGLERSACAVEVNCMLVPKSQHAAQPLKAGDRVELVTLVGGG